jgi:very-short-patch-repair endonuclease
MMSAGAAARDTFGTSLAPARGRVGGATGVARFSRNSIKTVRARALRENVTEVEKRLWSKLRGAQIDGASFRRQHPAGDYILDFYCPSLRLAIELDGGQHALDAARDRARDEWLARHGVTVLRFWNSDVTQNLPGVLEVIALKVAELKLRSTASSKRWRVASPDKVT